MYTFLVYASGWYSDQSPSLESALAKLAWLSGQYRAVTMYDPAGNEFACGMYRNR